MLDEILDFLDDIKRSGGDFFIEAEAAPKTMQSFIDSYNAVQSPAITMDSDGIIPLKPDVNKWGLELRLYVNAVPPAGIRHLFSRNRTYKTEYAYRLNDNDIVWALFRNGCKIGIN